MAIMSDKWIRERSLKDGMIEPFVDGQKRQGTISYGLSSYGYDARVSDDFKIFTNVDNAIVDPKDFAHNSFVDRKTDVCIIPPNSFVLAHTVEYFRVPPDVLVICLDRKSEEHTSELQSLMRTSYAVFCLKKKKNTNQYT